MNRKWFRWTPKTTSDSRTPIAIHRRDFAHLAYFTQDLVGRIALIERAAGSRDQRIAVHSVARLMLWNGQHSGNISVTFRPSNRCLLSPTEPGSDRRRRLNLAAAGIDSAARAPRASAARVFASLVGAGLSGGAGAGVFDVLVAVARAGEPTGPRAVAWSLVAAVSLAGAAGAAVGAAIAVVAAGMVATVDLDVGAWLRRIRADPARDRAQAAGIWAATAGLGVVGAAVTAVDLLIGGQMAVRRNGAITTGGSRW